MARKEKTLPPEVGSGAPEFNLPAAQGGQLRLGLRTVRGPVVVVFYRGSWSEECVEYFRALAEREREINVAGATLVGIGPVEPDEAREFVRLTGLGSYVLYDYIRVTTRDYGLLQRDADHGDTARPAAFLIGADHEVLRAWLDERPAPGDILAEITGITGLPKEPEEEGEEKPKKRPKKTTKTAEETKEETAEETTEGTEGEAAGTKGAAEKRSAGRGASGKREAVVGEAESGDKTGPGEPSSPEAEEGRGAPEEGGETASPDSPGSSADSKGDDPARGEDR